MTLSVRTVPSVTIALLAALALAVAALLLTAGSLGGSDSAGATWNKQGATWNTTEAGATWNRVINKGATWN